MRQSTIIDETDDGSASTGSNEFLNPDSLKQSPQQLVPNNSIQNLFFGKMTQILKMADNDRTKIINDTTLKMGPIMLDVNSHNNLYEAW